MFFASDKSLGQCMPTYVRTTYILINSFTWRLHSEDLQCNAYQTINMFHFCLSWISVLLHLLHWHCTAILIIVSTVFLSQNIFCNFSWLFSCLFVMITWHCVLILAVRYQTYSLTFWRSGTVSSSSVSRRFVHVSLPYISEAEYFWYVKYKNPLSLSVIEVVQFE